jgi:hypothetical protein
MKLTELHGSTWQGHGELWLDPEGNEAQHYDCSLSIEKDCVKYTWDWEGKTQQGSFVFNQDNAIWIDSWHQSSPVTCQIMTQTHCIFCLFNTYHVPSNPDWAWRSQLSQRSSKELVLQMTNIAPWGEEARAVRMVFTKTPNQ